MDITNRDRAFGTTLSYHIAKKYGDTGLPDNSIQIMTKGSAGQSFCAFLVKGITVSLGDANDCVGKVFPKDYQKALQQEALKLTNNESVELDTQSPDASKDMSTINGDIFQDIEDILKGKKLDKTRGFVKYKRELSQYRPPEERINDYEEI